MLGALSDVRTEERAYADGSAQHWTVNCEVLGTHSLYMYSPGLGTELFTDFFQLSGKKKIDSFLDKSPLFLQEPQTAVSFLQSAASLDPSPAYLAVLSFLWFKLWFSVSSSSHLILFNFCL